jgi:DNA-binding transcriptional LysR family regulator/class 3 adenylate cyclase
MPEANASDLVGRSLDRRKLIAVVYADMVGYSRLIGLDDIGTLERLRALRIDVINPAIDQHGGNIVQTAGDSLLIVFDSIEGAVGFALRMQRQVSTREDGQSADRTIRFRVGINIGDVIADGTDLHGDGVNVAARLQAECPPGGICVSRSVRDHMRNRQDLVFEELGQLNLKNIDRPVEAYVLQLDDTAVTHFQRPVLPDLRVGLNFQQLHLFYRVAKLGSIPRAAKELRLAQSSVSAQLQEFERRCGVALLHRLPAGLTLTDAGHLALDQAERIFNQAGELRSMLQNFPDAQTGKLTVGGSLTAGEFFLPSVASRFRQRYPDIELSVVLDNSAVVLEKVKQGELDIGFVGTDAIEDDLIAIPCWEDQVVIIAAPDSVPRGSSSIQLIQSQPFVMREPGSATRQHIELCLRRRGLTVKTAMNVGSPEAVKRYVAAGVGWGFASKHSIATEVAASQLEIVDIDGWDCRRVFYATHRKGCYHLSISQREFVELAQTPEAGYVTSLSTRG